MMESLKTLEQIIAEVLEEKYYNEYHRVLSVEQIHCGIEQVMKAIVNNFLQYADYKKFIEIDDID